MISEETKQKIEKIISGYNYGQYSLLNDDLIIKYDLNNENIFIDKFYNHSALSSNDTCSGLMNKACLDIQLACRGLHIAKAVGNDNEYFNKSGKSSHCFLLAQDTLIINSGCFTDDKKTIDNIFEQNDPFVVDPSFKKIVRFSESGYKIKSLIDSDCKIQYSDSQILISEAKRISYFPLVMSEEGTLLYLRADFESKKFLGIMLQKKNSPSNLSRSYVIESKHLDYRFKNEPKVFQFIDHLRNANLVFA